MTIVPKESMWINDQEITENKSEKYRKDNMPNHKFCGGSTKAKNYILC